MELDQLRYFLQVVKEKSFTRAAESLAISQPALSRSIQKLEEEFQVPLFVRKSRSLDCTDAGKLFRERAEQILRLVEDTKAQIGDDGQTGRIRIGAIPTIAPYFLPAFLKSASKQFPHAVLEVFEDTTKALVQQCLQGELELAILALPISEKNLDTKKLFDEELMLALPSDHALTKKTQIQLKDLEEVPFIMLDEPHCLSSNILSFCHHRSFQPVIVGRTNQLSMVQELVSLSHGVSMIPTMAQRIDRSKTRVYRSLAGVPPKRTIGVVWDPYRFQSQLVKSLLRMLGEYPRD